MGRGKEKHQEYVHELTDDETDDSWVAQLSQMIDEMEIKTDKYVEKYERMSRKRLNRKPKTRNRGTMTKRSLAEIC